MPTPFRITQFCDGRLHVRQADSPADYLRCLIDETAEDFGISCHTLVSQRGSGWLWVLVRCPLRLNRPTALRFNQLCARLHEAFEANYEQWGCGRGPGVRAWEVRHRDGHPWI